MKKATAVNRLDRVQSLACLRIAGAMRSTSTAALENLWDSSPLHFAIIGEVRMAKFRQENSRNYKGSDEPESLQYEGEVYSRTI